MMSQRNSSGIGASILRKEDHRFLTGTGRFIDDFRFPEALECYVLRSPHAHAKILNIDLSSAKAAPGVVAVFAGKDMADDQIGSMKALWQVTSKDGNAMAEPPRWAIARNTVRHVGEPVAIVIADSFNHAADAAELIDINYNVLSAETNATSGLTETATQIHTEAPNNICFEWEQGNAAAVDQAMTEADKIIRVNLTNNRLVGAAIETRGVVASFDPMTDSLVLYSTTQAPHHIRICVAEQLNLRESDLRVISPDVGGGFGNKGKHYPEETFIAWAARKLGRTVK